MNKVSCLQSELSLPPQHNKNSWFVASPHGDQHAIKYGAEYHHNHLPLRGFAIKKENYDMFDKKGFYRYIFNTKFNLGFESPKLDTCSISDNFDYLKDFDQHNKHAENASEEIKKDKEEARTDFGIVFISFDLQQAMLLPKISTAVSFYLRQHWMYNFGVHFIQKKDKSSNVQ